MRYSSYESDIHTILYVILNILFANASVSISSPYCYTRRITILCVICVFTFVCYVLVLRGTNIYYTSRPASGFRAVSCVF